MNRPVPWWRLAVLAALVFAAARTNADNPRKETAADVARVAAVVKVAVAADKPDADGKQTVTIKLKLKKPWLVLANPIGNPDPDLAGGKTVVTFAGKSKPEVVKIEYPTGKVVKFPMVGDVRVYENEVEIKAYIRRAKEDAEKLEVRVFLAPQNDELGVCLLPATLKATVP